MENKSLLYMRRNGNYWRMDVNTYLRFIKHVRIYFRDRMDLTDTIYDKMIYAEIPVRNMAVICFLFGGYSRNNEELILVEFFPKEPILPWKSSFAMLLYTENKRPIPVFMDVRH